MFFHAVQHDDLAILFGIVTGPRAESSKTMQRHAVNMQYFSLHAY